MERILISGASGFVGKNLVGFLRNEGFTIEVITRENLNNPHTLRILSGDTIVHLAGKAHDLKNSSDSEEFYKVNFQLTKNLYDEFLKSNARSFIFISSVKAAADTVNGVLTEDVAPQPKTHYGKSKLMAEQYIQSQTLTIGRAYYILRPCMIHGPGNKGNLNLLYKLVLKGIPYPLAAFENRRSFLSIGNFCFLVKELLTNDIVKGVYNVADDDSLSTNDVIKILAQSLGIKPRLWKLPIFLVKALVIIGDKFNSPLNSHKLDKLTENYVVNNQKLTLAIKKQMPLSVREGLMKTALSFREDE